MFVDRVLVNIEAGNGGDGVVSFRHEKFVDRGGPNGGDGGNGGSVVLVASNNQNTLAKFRFQKTIRAEDGQSGAKSNKHGKSGQNLEVPVPVGTVVLDEDGKELFDLTEDGQQETVAVGGKGGFGNAHFVSSVRQAPKFAEKGEVGEKLSVVLELRMIADVGLIGLPNAGKSTLLSVVSNANPEIANYPFTTLVPNLGVVDIDDKTSLLFADIPGLIEGASEGKGLGDEFLRHIQRTKVLVHLIDAYSNDLENSYKTIQKELKDYKPELAKKPQIVALTKIEGLDEEIITDRLSELQKLVPAKTLVMAISSQSKQGVKELLYEVKNMVATEAKKIAKKAKIVSDGIPVYTLVPQVAAWKVTKDEQGVFKVTGHKIEKFAARVDLTDELGQKRIKDIMRKMGITRELDRKGLRPGDLVAIGRIGTFTY